RSRSSGSASRSGSCARCSRSASGHTGSSTGWASRTSRARSSAACSCSSCSASRDSSSRWSGSTSGGFSATWRAAPCTRSTKSSEATCGGCSARDRDKIVRRSGTQAKPASPLWRHRQAVPLMTKRVLVTGGAGFISSNFIRHLLAKTPYDVVSLDALTYAGNPENLSDVMSHERLSFVHGDVRNAELVRDVVSEVDVIVNAAAESHVEKSNAAVARDFVTVKVV